MFHFLEKEKKLHGTYVIALVKLFLKSQIVSCMQDNLDENAMAVIQHFIALMLDKTSELMKLKSDIRQEI